MVVMQTHFHRNASKDVQPRKKKDAATILRTVHLSQDIVERERSSRSTLPIYIKEILCCHNLLLVQTEENSVQMRHPGMHWLRIRSKKAAAGLQILCSKVRRPNDSKQHYVLEHIFVRVRLNC